jgi:hypothetical protein
MQRSERMAVVVLPREPLMDWVNSVTPDDPMWEEDLAGRANVYFIPRFETLDEAQAYIEETYDAIFRCELAEWFDDEAVFPGVRTFEMFMEWFDVVFDVVVFDTQPPKGLAHHN